MTASDPITSFGDLLSQLEYDDFDAFRDALLDEHEPYLDEVILEDSAESGGQHLVIAAISRALDQATLRLSYPFLIQDYYDEIAWLDDFYAAHSAAEAICYFDDTILGILGDADDRTVELAEWASLPEDGLVELLGCAWHRVSGPEADHDGKAIFGWFVPFHPEATSRPDRVVGLAIGGNALYVERGHWPEGSDLIVNDWPVPCVKLRYYGGDSAFTQEHRREDVLGVLRSRLFGPAPGLPR